MKTRWILLGICFLSSILVLAAVMELAGVSDPKNGFSRYFLNHPIKIEKSIRLKGEKYYITGISSSKIYLGNYSHTDILFSSALNLADSQYRLLTTPDSVAIAWRLLHVQVDSPRLYLFEGLTPAILETGLNSTTSHRAKLNINNFTSFLSTSPNLGIVRTYNKPLAQDILQTVPLDSMQHSSGRYILEKQQDGRFSVDGMLLRQVKGSRVFYIYFYRNEFICFDPLLRLQYNARTIDTNRVARLKIGRIEKENKTTLLSPPPTVNRKACAGDRFLLINSGLRADNESVHHFMQNAVIDLYSIQNGAYRGSFYLEGTEGEDITSMGIYQQNLFVTHGVWLSLYHFDY